MVNPATYAYDIDSNMLTFALECEAFHSVEFGHFIVHSLFTGCLEVHCKGKLKFKVETRNQHFLFRSCIFLSCTEPSAINTLCCISSVFTVYLTIKPF